MIWLFRKRRCTVTTSPKSVRRTEKAYRNEQRLQAWWQRKFERALKNMVTAVVEGTPAAVEAGLEEAEGIFKKWCAQTANYILKEAVK